MDSVYDKRYLDLQFYISFTTCMEETKTHSPAVHHLHLAANVVCYLNSTAPMENAIPHLFTQLQKSLPNTQNPENLNPNPETNYILLADFKFRSYSTMSHPTYRVHSESIHIIQTPQSPNTFTKLKGIQAQPTHAHNTITAKRNHKRTTSNPDTKGNREENYGSPCA